jgi:hypothetical protein
MYNGTFYVDTCKSYACKGIKTQIQSLPSKLSPFKKNQTEMQVIFVKISHYVISW